MFLYKEEEVFDGAKHTVFKCAHWQSYRSKPTSITGTIASINIIGGMIASGESCISVTKYVERILRLKKKDLEAAEQKGVPA